MREKLSTLYRCRKILTLFADEPLKVKKVKEVDLYSAFIVVPHTQGA